MLNGQGRGRGDQIMSTGYGNHGEYQPALPTQCCAGVLCAYLLGASLHVSVGGMLHQCTSVASQVLSNLISDFKTIQ